MENLQPQYKILIVEDETILLQTLGDEFRHSGFRVFQAQDGAEGLDLALKEPPDLIIVDVLMPKKDGISMLKEMRINPKLAKIPAIILTNLSDTKTIEQALESGAYDFFVKSDWEPKALVGKVKEKLAINP